MRWRETDYELAYIYARGYYDARADTDPPTNLDWMTADEAAIYGKGYDKGIADFNEMGEGK